VIHLCFKKDEDNYTYITDEYFEFYFENNWLMDEQSKAIVKEIDNSEVISPNCIESPILGQISPDIISGGAKMLLMALKCDFTNEDILCSKCMGDNCLGRLMEIAENKEIYVYMNHYLGFTEEQLKRYKVHFYEKDVTIDDILSYIAYYVDSRGEYQCC